MKTTKKRKLRSTGQWRLPPHGARYRYHWIFIPQKSTTFQQLIQTVEMTEEEEKALLTGEIGHITEANIYERRNS
jgi:hypothetical protein